MLLDWDDPDEQLEVPEFELWRTLAPDQDTLKLRKKLVKMKGVKLEFQAEPDPKFNEILTESDRTLVL